MTITNVNALTIDPTTPTTLYAGTGSGVFKTTNGGASWSAINSGLSNTLVQVLAIDPVTPATLYAGVGGVFKSTNGGSSWGAINSGLFFTQVNGVFALAIDPATPATIYAGTFGYGLFKSTNGGASWSAINNGTGPNLAFVRALAIDPATPTTLYAGMSPGFSPGVFKSTDGGGSWSAINNGLTNTSVSALAIDPLTPTTLYAGMSLSGGGVFKSTDGGASWNATGSALGLGLVFALVVDPATPTTLYAVSGGVFKSTNGGASWSAINNGLTVTGSFPNAVALAIDPATPTTLYAGTYGGGVFKSTDGGASWSAINSGLTNTLVQALAIDPVTPTTVYAGTYGGGVFVLRQVAPPVTHNLTVASTNPSSGVDVTVSPADNSGLGNGTTQFTRTYNNGVVVTLTAPGTAGGNNFSSWTGCDGTSGVTCTVTMNADRIVAANYVTAPPVVRTLTVASTNPNSGVNITVSPSDNNGQGNGTTQFTRSYNHGVVTLTAPGTAGGNSFSSWTSCDGTSAATCTVAMTADHTVTANYVTPPPPNPAPTITSFSPPTGFQNAPIYFFQVNGANFQTGATVSFSGGQSIIVDETSLSVFPNEIDGNLSVASTAAPGFYDVTVSDPDMQSVTKNGVLNILTVPPAPENLSAVAGNQMVLLNWKPSQAPPDAYKVYIYKMVGTDPILLETQVLPGPVQVTTAVVATLQDGSSLQNGQLYKFEVRAVGTGGESTPSAYFAYPGFYAAPAHPLHPILFLHGISGRANDWSPTTEFLSNTLGWKFGGTLSYAPNVDPRFGLEPLKSNFLLSGDYFTVNFGNTFADYPAGSARLGILHQGDEVGGFIRTLQSRGPISVVAHSMGGLAARACIQDPSAQCVDSSKIADLVTLGTPHWGVDSSYLRNFSIQAFLIKTFLGWDLPRVLSSRGLIDMDSGCVANGDPSGTIPVSDFLHNLNSSTLPTEIRYVVESGNFLHHDDECEPGSFKQVFTDLVVPTTSATLNGLTVVPQVWSLLQTDLSHIDMPKHVGEILCALDQNCLILQVMSPVDIQVTAPNGQTISNNLTSMPGAEYTNVVTENGHETVMVLIPFPQGGQYTIKATPKPGAQSTDTFTITMTQNGVTTTIADHIMVQNIPAAGFQTHVNSRPFANAGPDQLIECKGPNGTTVTLNGSVSGDQDGDPLAYVWTDSQGNVVGTTALANVNLRLGTQTYTLSVTDPWGYTATAQTHVTVRDTTPPSLSVALSPNILWPPNNKLVQVTASVQATDVCDPNPAVTLVSITSNDTDDDPRDIQGAVFGTDDRSFLLGARRADRGRARIYTITYQATDHSGNSTTSIAQVTVPRDQDNDRDDGKREGNDRSPAPDR